MQNQAVHDCGHAKLAHAVVEIVATGLQGVMAETAAALPGGQVGGCEVGRAADEFRHHRGEGLDGVLRGLAGGDRLALGEDFGERSIGLGGEFRVRFTGHAAQEFRSEFGVGGAVGIKQLLPFGLARCAGGAGVPAGVDVGGNFERAALDAQRGARGGDFVLAERGAVHIVRAGLVWRTFADDRLAADQRWLVALRFGGTDRGVDGVDVVAVDVADDVPAIGFKALGCVIREPAFDMAVDGNAVVVIEGDQLGQLPGAGQRTSLVRNAFHHAAVAEEGIAVVVDDGEAVAVEFGGQQLLGQCHAHGVADALAERAGGRFDARGVAEFRVARGFAVQLAEALEFVERQVVAGQVQQRVEQHRAMPVGEHEAVAVGPTRIGRVVLQVALPQGDRHFGHPHRCAGVSRIGRLNGVDGQDADGVGQGGLRTHERDSVGQKKGVRCRRGEAILNVEFRIVKVMDFIGLLPRCQQGERVFLDCSIRLSGLKRPYVTSGQGGSGYNAGRR